MSACGITIRENRTGFYLCVLETGIVQPGDQWELQERLNPDGSIRAINRCIYLEFDPLYAQRVAQMQGLGHWWKEQVIERAIKQGEHWTATMILSIIQWRRRQPMH